AGRLSRTGHQNPAGAPRRLAASHPCAAGTTTAAWPAQPDRGAPPRRTAAAAVLPENRAGVGGCRAGRSPAKGQVGVGRRRPQPDRRTRLRAGLRRLADPRAGSVRPRRQRTPRLRRRHRNRLPCARPDARSPAETRVDGHAMTATTLPILDWRRMPLQGRVLIEASAGTGKTWNIGVIYLRLLLEAGLPVEKILVTTFTEAAAQELRERLRRRLVEAEHLLESAALDAASDDPLQAWLAALCTNEEQARQALRRIQLARTDLDRAPVSTIHAFCQRVQRDYPLESGAAFGSDKLFDESQLQRECVEDFWRRRYLAGAVDPREAELLLKDGPEGLLRDLGGLGNNSDARIESGGLAELERQVATLKLPENIAGLQQLVDAAALYKRSNAALRSRLSEIVKALREDDEAQLAASLSEVFEPEKLAAQESTAHTGELSAHPLILALQTLR